jgi:hypothetical protein
MGLRFGQGGAGQGHQVRQKRRYRQILTIMRHGTLVDSAISAEVARLQVQRNNIFQKS